MRVDTRGAICRGLRGGRGIRRWMRLRYSQARFMSSRRSFSSHSGSNRHAGVVQAERVAAPQSLDFPFGVGNLKAQPDTVFSQCAGCARRDGLLHVGQQRMETRGGMPQKYQAQNRHRILAGGQLGVGAKLVCGLSQVVFKQLQFLVGRVQLAQVLTTTGTATCAATCWAIAV